MENTVRCDFTSLPTFEKEEGKAEKDGAQKV